MRPKRIGQALCLLLIIVGLAGSALPASAHANLVRSEPPASAVLDAAPTRVKLWFSETPEVSFSRIQLFDKNALEIGGVGALHADPSDNKLLTASLPPLPHGIFTVSWKAVSAVDGHVTAGGFAFVIGKEMVPTGGIRAALPGGATSVSGPTLVGVSVRWLSYLSLAMLIGGFAFAPLVFQPALNSVTKARQGKGTPAVSPLPPGVSFSHDSGLFFALFWGWVLALCAAIAGAFVQAATVGTDIGTLLTGTRFGLLFWLRIAVLVVIGGLLAYRQS
ncbi:MAG TPA: copper resistance CopC family protein, partial [Aggregatilineales bacterium]|nr:copper resistance CopC family protein [Aggregatilineales bacterium]